MKNISSILLMGILLFNWCGYRFFSYFQEGRAISSLESALNNQQYDDADLISVKIPAKHVSSYSNTTHFERVDGQIEINGIQYSYVKRRLYNDSIEMLCIANYVSMQLKKNNGEFFKLVNDIQHPGQEKKTGLNKNYTGDDYKTTDLWEMNPLFNKKSNSGSFYLITIPSFFAFSEDRPPDTIA
jgi:hypothetical protein